MKSISVKFILVVGSLMAAFIAIPLLNAWMTSRTRENAVPANTADYRRNAGETMDADAVPIPVEEAEKLFLAQTKRHYFVFLARLAALFGTIYLVFRLMIGNRLSAIAKHFQNTARQDGSLAIAPIPVSGKDEIGAMTVSFNALAGRLHNLYDACEEKVRQRTAELEARMLEQKKVEEALRRSEARLQVMFDKGPLGIATADLDRTILQANQAYCRMLGYAAEEIQGKKVEDFTYPEDIIYGRKKIEELVADEIPGYTIEKRYVRKDGILRWGRTTCTAIRDARGKPEYLFAIIEDITTSKQAAEAMRASEQRYRLLAQNVKDIIWTCDMNFRWTYLSPSFELLSGHTVEEGMALSLAELLTPEGYRRAMQAFEERQQEAACDPDVLTQPTILEAELVCKNGKTLWTEINASFVLSPIGMPIGIVGITRDISARKALQMQLSQAKDAAEAANRAKSEFIANTCHEIRTPMTAILGYADILRESAKNPEENEAIRTIIRNGEHLLEIINGILDLSKIEAGKLTVDAAVCFPHALVSEVLALMRVPAQSKRIPLEVEYENPIPETIHSDPVRLRQVLINLVGNAVKFTETGEVRIAMRLLDADSRNPRLQFRIIDTGIGMTAEEAESLFQPFTQVQSAGNRRYGGTGLGLAISRRLANLLGGDISLESAPKKGSTFTFAVETGDLHGVKLIGSHTEATASNTSAATWEKPAAVALDCRILLAEDGPDNQKLIAFLLRKAGAEVVLAENGERAVEQAIAAQRAGYPFAVILMDMQMPLLNGYDATKKLRSMSYAHPIVALTAHAMSEDRERCLDAGCDDYLSKPIDRERLMSTIAFHAGQPEKNRPTMAGLS